jgi:hypothetical protein
MGRREWSSCHCRAISCVSAVSGRRAGAGDGRAHRMPRFPAVAVADQEPARVDAVAEVHEQVAGLLGDPGLGAVGGDSGGVRAAASVLDHDKHVGFLPPQLPSRRTGQCTTATADVFDFATKGGRRHEASPLRAGDQYALQPLKVEFSWSTGAAGTLWRPRAGGGRRALPRRWQTVQNLNHSARGEPVGHRRSAEVRRWLPGLQAEGLDDVTPGLPAPAARREDAGVPRFAYRPPARPSRPCRPCHAAPCGRPLGSRLRRRWRWWWRRPPRVGRAGTRR